MKKYKQMKPKPRRGNCVSCAWFIEEDSTCRVINPQEITNVTEEDSCHKFEKLTKSTRHSIYAIKRKRREDEAFYDSDIY